MTLTIADLFTPASLAEVWKVVRASCHRQLVRDPLDHLAFEANLDSALKQLAYAVTHHHYRPAPPTTVRAAKNSGLTRSLSFLDIGDTLVLKTIVDAIQESLHKAFPDCVAFGRSQRRALPLGTEDYATWFHAWMRHHRVVDRLLRAQGCSWVVRADVSSFFPSISHQLLHQCVMQHADIDEQLCNLLFLILESMAPRPAYAVNRRVGLPQEDYDASRVLAHAFLGPIDECFGKEIAQGTYARWVDDITVGVSTESDGKKVLRRLERALEERGLFVNSAKSKIVRVNHFADSLYPEWNDFLDKAERAAKRRSTAEGIDLSVFEGRLADFLATPTNERLDTWSRVLRRFYSVSKLWGSSLLEKHVVEHLTEFPASASKITDYLLSRSCGRETLGAVLGYLSSDENIYEDTEIRLYELLLQWAVPDDPVIIDALASTCLDHFSARSHFRGHPPLTDHVRGLIALVVYKFGAPSTHIAEFANAFLAGHVPEPTFARYALCMLCGTSAHRRDALAYAAGLEDRAIRHLHCFLTTIQANPRPYARALRKRVKECRVTGPTYVYFPARMLPLVNLVRCSRRYRQQWDRHLLSVLKKLERGPQPLRDARSIHIIQRELDTP